MIFFGLFLILLVQFLTLKKCMQNMQILQISVHFLFTFLSFFVCLLFSCQLIRQDILIQMSKILLISCLVAVALANLHLNVKYRSFIDGQVVHTTAAARQIYNDFHSPYKTKSEIRFKIFSENLIEIRNHNMGKFSWKQGVNDFSDMTWEEFKQQRLMAPQDDCSATNSFKAKPTNVKAIPDSYEWNNFGMVSPVKNQGSCGSCWTFSTVGSLESFWNILGKGKNVTFAEQQLVDCAGDFDNHGCQGGLPSHAFQYIKYAGGIESSVTYPYTAKNGQCVFRKDIAVGYVKYGAFNITKGDQIELADRLYNAGPIAISFQVISGFRNYASGVFRADNCGKTTKDVNHAVLATGYGEESGMKFWNIKNSWGPTWGNSGYFKMERGANMCAVAQCNAYPLVDKAGIQQVSEQ